MINAGGLERLGFVNHQDFILQDDGDGVYIRWISNKSQPTEGEISTSSTAWKSEYDAQEYARNRATAYASTGDQLDMQYWDGVNDTTTWKDHVASVKGQFPKP